MKLIPQKGQQIRVLRNGYDEIYSTPLLATVVDLLAIQFTAETEEGRLMFFHYTNYKELFDDEPTP